MGLSSKQVSTDGFDWSQDLLKNAGLDFPEPTVPSQPRRRLPQQQRPPTQQQGPPLRCPRCDSTNTKFCYYNNYSRTQPRHFCKACKRHWTNGGTLRNVPVGGSGRKPNKRPKTTPSAAAATDDTTTAATNNIGGTPFPFPTIPEQHLLSLPPLPFAPDVLCQALLRSPPPPPPSDYTHIDVNGCGSYLGSLLSLPPAPQIGGATAGGMSSYESGGGYPFSTSSSSPPFFFDFTGQEGLAEEATGAAITASMEGPWEMLPPQPPPPPPCSSGSTTTTTSSGSTLLESSPSSGYWGSCWDDLTGFLSP